LNVLSISADGPLTVDICRVAEGPFGAKSGAAVKIVLHSSNLHQPGYGCALMRPRPSEKSLRHIDPIGKAPDAQHRLGLADGYGDRDQLRLLRQQR